jgi:hypothetical protein
VVVRDESNVEPAYQGLKTVQTSIPLPDVDRCVSKRLLAGAIAEASFTKMDDEHLLINSLPDGCFALGSERM